MSRNPLPVLRVPGGVLVPFSRATGPAGVPRSEPILGIVVDPAWVRAGVGVELAELFAAAAAAAAAEATVGADATTACSEGFDVVGTGGADAREAARAEVGSEARGAGGAEAAPAVVGDEGLCPFVAGVSVAGAESGRSPGFGELGACPGL